MKGCGGVRCGFSENPQGLGCFVVGPDTVFKCWNAGAKYPLVKELSEVLAADLFRLGLKFGGDHIASVVFGKPFLQKLEESIVAKLEAEHVQH